LPSIIKLDDGDDDLPTPRPPTRVEDPLKTPTPQTVSFSSASTEPKEPETKEDEFVMGGVNGFDVYRNFQASLILVFDLGDQGPCQ
jgi:hypothetical protein